MTTVRFGSRIAGRRAVVGFDPRFRGTVAELPVTGFGAASEIGGAHFFETAGPCQICRVGP